ncbi:peptidoglycan-binding protein [Oscillatoria sp. FACHB-1407]|uniref:peptidoglycan-binding domain-containing protein n=1 Tax=Oscillatoria sp. FACHB-1407 TaxID=2692847 RepID=UPI001687BD1E|nr:peptidoglycan-binding protein [Oscillatoria sp. FACHB-1407]MBD2464463.1 peptidoglycan-binding protein [Oscillatoria sp. FACHB-1407]
MLLPIASIFDIVTTDAKIGTNTETEIDTPRCSTMLVQGDSGADVLELQRLLLRWSAFSGYRQTDDADGMSGYFDEAVRTAVETFQGAMFLQPNGVVGALTWRSLYSGVPIHMPTLHPGAQGIEVSRLQKILAATADLPSDAITSVYDATTEQVVRQVQDQAGLSVSGIVDSDTWRALSRAIAYSRMAGNNQSSNREG